LKPPFLPLFPPSQETPIRRKQDDATLVIAAVGIAFPLTVLNAGDAVLQATATSFVALFLLFLFLLQYASD